MVLGVGMFSVITAVITSYAISTGSFHPGGDDLPDQLAALAGLRDNAALTEDEFSASKAALLRGRRS